MSVFQTFGEKLGQKYFHRRYDPPYILLGRYDPSVEPSIKILIVKYDFSCILL